MLWGTKLEADSTGSEMDFVAQQNIQRFKRLLEFESDPAKRSTIEKLLRREKSRLADIRVGRPQVGE